MLNPLHHCWPWSRAEEAADVDYVEEHVSEDVPDSDFDESVRVLGKRGSSSQKKGLFLICHVP